MNEHEMYDYDDTLAITNTRRKQLEEEALAHHGILGMKWGIRRYQNEDGSLTELGQRHYDMLERKQELEYDRRNRKEEADVERQRLKYQRASDKQGLHNQRDRDVYDFANQERERKLHRKNVLTAVAVGALAVGGGIALHNYFKNKGNTPIDAPELTTTISTGKDNVQKLLFNTNGISNGTANYDFGGSGKNASIFGQTKIDDLKKLMDSSSKAKTLSKGKIKIENLAKKGNWGVAADDKQDVLEKLDSFTSFKKPVSISRNGKWEADNGTVSDLSNILAKRRQAQLNSNTAADMLSKQRAFERRKNLAGQIFEPGVRADKKGDVNWKKLAYRSGMKIPEGNDIFSYAEKMTNPLTSRSTSTSTPVDLLAKKAAYDTSVNNLGSDLDKTLNKFKHSNIGDAYDMIDSKLMHTAMAISSRRRAQLETRDDYLMHYGRKGMKWGEDIFAEDELKKRQISGQSQYAQQLKAEAYKRKYGNTSVTTNNDAARANGAAIRARQKAIREAQAKYGGGSNSDYANQQMAKQAEESRRTAQNKAASEKYGNKYGTVGQGSSYVNGQISNQQKKTAENNMEYANNITRTTDRYVDDYFSRNQNAKLYKSLSVDAANDSADMIGSPTLNGVMSGKRKKLSKEDDSREKLFNSMKEQVRKDIHDDIDAHADGLTPAQVAKAHGEADIAIDKKFNEKAHKYDPMMLWETNADVHEKVEKSLQETGRNYAMSTGGVQDISQRKPIVEVDENDIDTSPAYGDKRTNKPTPVEETSKSTQVGETPKPKNPSAKDMAKRFKQENIAQEGLKDSRSVVTGQVEIRAEDIYDVGERGNVKEITEMQDALKEQYDHLTALRSKPRFAKYEKEIQQELDILDGNIKWLESTK